MTIAIADIADTLVTNDYYFIEDEYPYYARTNRDGSVNEVSLEENSLTLIRYNANGRQLHNETVALNSHAAAQQALRLIA